MTWPNGVVVRKSSVRKLPNALQTAREASARDPVFPLAPDLFKFDCSRVFDLRKIRAVSQSKGMQAIAPHEVASYEN